MCPVVVPLASSPPSPASSAATAPASLTVRTRRLRRRLLLRGARRLEPTLFRNFRGVSSLRLELLLLVRAQLGDDPDVVPLADVGQRFHHVSHDGLPILIPGAQGRGALLRLVELATAGAATASRRVHLVDQPSHQPLDPLPQLHHELRRDGGHVEPVKSIQGENLIRAVPARLVPLLSVFPAPVLARELSAGEEHHRQRGHRRGVAHVHLGGLDALVKRDVARPPRASVELAVDRSGVHGGGVRLGEGAIGGANVELHRRG